MGFEDGPKIENNTETEKDKELEEGERLYKEMDDAWKKYQESVKNRPISEEEDRRLEELNNKRRAEGKKTISRDMLPGVNTEEMKRLLEEFGKKQSEYHKWLGI